MAAIFGDRFLYRAPEELVSLGARIGELLDAYAERLTDPQPPPSGGNAADGNTADGDGESG